MSKASTVFITYVLSLPLAEEKRQELMRVSTVYTMTREVADTFRHLKPKYYEAACMPQKRKAHSSADG